MMTLEEKIARLEYFAKLCEQNGMHEWKEEHEQFAAWLRELKERRKAPEIVRCGECECAINIGTPDMMCNNSKGWVVATDSNFGCILAERAERRTE